MFKLNDNITTKKKGEDGYDPCGKYEMIWDVMCHNMNALIETAEKDVTIDETSWWCVCLRAPVALLFPNV